MILSSDKRKTTHPQTSKTTVNSPRPALPPNPRTRLEGAHERVVYAHHGPRVVELPAVVGRREQSYQVAPRKELVPVLNDLVGQDPVPMPIRAGSDSGEGGTEWGRGGAAAVRERVKGKGVPNDNGNGSQAMNAAEQS